VRRSDGSQQWAYQSHPLYTWVKEKVPGEVATNVAQSAQPGKGGALGAGGAAAAAPAAVPASANAATGKRGRGPAATSDSLTPPRGWQVVRFTPAAVMTLPDGIDVQIVHSAQAVGFTDFNGMTVYAFDGDVRHDGQICTSKGSCDVQWLPVAAPTLAMPVGELSIVTRPDGSKQWAYKGHGLYTYVGDKLPGDAYGAGVAKRWEVAALTEDFRPANVGVTTLDGYGDVMSRRGMTLYGSYIFEKRIGARNQRDDFTHNSYRKGKQLGAQGCVDAQCLKQWHPFAAPADAQSDGWWEPITRPDGTKQWTYKGFAMYTYAGDKAPGDHSGQAVYDFINPDGTPEHFQREMFLLDITKVLAGVGVYWNVAHP
jgi:predicted lipoprotein with Yx(FWY)xxD motif